MKRPTVMVVFGTRPEAIKLAPVIWALRRDKNLVCRICVTAQHRHMLDQMLEAFGLSADFDLNLMRPAQNLNAFSARALRELGGLFKSAKPGLVLVQGDTTTALMGALAAFHERISVGHVEAGLRTHDRNSPFPEEANRALIDSLSALLFAPTPRAKSNLLAEDAVPGRIFVTGNTVIDAMRWAVSHPRFLRDKALRRALAAAEGGQIVLVTMHRRESFDTAIRDICGVLQGLLKRHPGLHLLFPVHLNPRVQATVKAALRHPRAHLLPTLDYFDLTLAMRRARFVMTDSGGIQEEATSLGKPTLILRSATERPEAVEAGVARLVGGNPRAAASWAERLLKEGRLYSSMARPSDVFGDGKAGERIAQIVRRFLKKQ